MLPQSSARTYGRSWCQRKRARTTASAADGGITKAGDTYLRRMLFVGAMAVIRHAERHGTRRPWLMKLLNRRHPRVAAIALANKIGRIAWALMTSGERYREPVAA